MIVDGDKKLRRTEGRCVVSQLIAPQKGKRTYLLPGQVYRVSELHADMSVAIE